MINLIFAGSPMSILCPYDVGNLDSAIVDDAHLTHPELISHGEPTRSTQYADPRRFVLGSGPE